jgi:hypothetical protein
VTGAIKRKQQEVHMTSRILTILTILALPGSALADVGHIAEQGHGHSHWDIYVLLGCVLIGLVVLAHTYMSEG